jgi:hypothetical protein
LAASTGLWDRLDVLPTFDLLDLQATEDPRGFRLAARRALCTPFGFLYGGSGIAASIEAAERATGRPLQWITTQFIGAPVPGRGRRPARRSAGPRQGDDAEPGVRVDHRS